MRWQKTHIADEFDFRRRDNNIYMCVVFTKVRCILILSFRCLGQSKVTLLLSRYFHGIGAYAGRW